MKFLLLLCFLLTVNFIAAQKKIPSDSAQARTTVTNFYKWYNTNWKKLSAFRLYKGKTKKDSPPYVIDWEEAGRYFSYLRKNVPYFAEGFITTEKKRLTKAEIYFQKAPEDDIPAGFDYDSFTNSQESPGVFLKELLNGSNRWKIIYPEKGQAHISVMYPEGDLFCCSDLVKEKGVWKITGLSCEDGGN